VTDHTARRGGRSRATPPKGAAQPHSPPSHNGTAHPPENGAPATDPLYGRVEVTPQAVATLASRAIEQSYGVVGLASRHSRPGLAELLRRDEQQNGVQVTFTDDRIVIDLFVILEYGTRISEVAYNLMSSVKFAVESALEMPVVEVNVNVQGIRVSK
jgi:uncharacterized alkaline shock family protein YloU